MSWGHIRNPSFPPLSPPRMEERSSSETSLLSQGQTPTSAILGTLLLYLKKKGDSSWGADKATLYISKSFLSFEDKERKRIQHLIYDKSAIRSFIKTLFSFPNTCLVKIPCLCCMYNRRFMLLFLKFYLHELSLLNDKLFIFSFIFISWRLITLQYYSGFCHTLTWISHGFTCIPHPNLPSHLPLDLIPLALPSAPGPSTWLMHPTWAGQILIGTFKELRIHGLLLTEPLTH